MSAGVKGGDGSVLAGAAHGILAGSGSFGADGFGKTTKTIGSVRNR